MERALRGTAGTPLVSGDEESDEEHRSDPHSEHASDKEGGGTAEGEYGYDRYRYHNFIQSDQRTRIAIRQARHAGTHGSPVDVDLRSVLHCRSYTSYFLPTVGL